jgi:hypothetical protein
LPTVLLIPLRCYWLRRYLDDWCPYLTRIVTARIVSDPPAADGSENSVPGVADAITKLKHERLKKQAGIPDERKDVPNPVEVRATLQQAKDSGDYGKVAELLRDYPYLADRLAQDVEAVNAEATELLGEKDLTTKKKKGKTMKKKKKKRKSEL